MSKIQLIGRPNGNVILVCSEHPEFNIDLGYSVSPSVAFRYANSHYLGSHIARDGYAKTAKVEDLE
jgi:hypothetical protein